jgi:hypothetical protein
MPTGMAAANFVLGRFDEAAGASGAPVKSRHLCNSPMPLYGARMA